MAKGNKPKTKKVKAKRARAKWAKAKKAKGKKPKPRTPKTFHRFLDLPKELRLKVWEQALFEARPDRRIIVYQLRVVPFKQSVSPLLLVNYESRDCAKAFYNVKLDVYAVPDLSDSQIEFLDKQKQWARIPGIERAVDGRIYGYTDEWVRRKFEGERMRLEWRDVAGRRASNPLLFDFPRLEEEERPEIDRREQEFTVHLEDHWAEYVEEQLRRWGSESATKAETSGPTKGALYISPRHDVFIEGYECGRHFHSDNASNNFGAKLAQRLACHHITAILDDAIREKISTLVLVRPQTVRGPGHCVFASGKAISYAGQALSYLRDEHDWRQTEFPSVESYFRLIPRSYTSPGFLKQVTEADGPKLSQILEQWVCIGLKDLKGQTVWSLVKIKSSLKTPSYGYPLRSADWTQVMMAHWDPLDFDSARQVIVDCGGGTELW